jgi:hypothetical protein
MWVLIIFLSYTVSVVVVSERVASMKAESLP